MAASGAARSALRPSFTSLVPALQQFGVRAWVVAALATITVGLVTGIPMVMIDNPWFLRMTPVRPQDYIVWVASAILIGLIAGTYAVVPWANGVKSTVAGGLLSYLAIGCPICNKVVVLLLGVGGALTFVGPAQLFLGIASVLLLIWTLLLRADALVEDYCVAPAAGR